MAKANLSAQAESINSIHPKMRVAGFVPASPQKRTRRSDMLLPKPAKQNVIKALNDQKLAWYLGRRAPRDMRALTRICETADIIEAAGETWLLVQADSCLIDDLASFQAELTDLEPEVDDDKDSDNAMEAVRGPHIWHVIYDDREPEDYE